MTRTVRVLKRAYRDIEEIDRYLRRESPALAERLVGELIDAMETLADHSERTPRPQDPRLRALGFRYLVHRPYLVFFKIAAKQVRVYRVLHGRRAYARLL